MESTVLLTGATGLIGRQTIAPLQKLGFKVLAGSRSGEDVGGAEGVALDILDPAQPRQVFASYPITHLVHLAWHDHPVDRWTSPANLDWAAATLRLVRDFSEAGGKRVVAAGTCAEYEWGDAILTEASPLKQNSLYGAAKATTGMSLKAAAATLGVSLAWARIFFCYGPGEPKGRLLGDLIKGIAVGETVDCTDGLQERDFLHTGDIGRALAAILASDVEGAINVASGEATPVKDLIGAVAGQMGHPERVNLGARKRPENDPKRVLADVTRLRDEVGFVPAFDIRSGVANVLKTEDL